MTVLDIPRLFWNDWLLWPIHLLGIDWTGGLYLFIYRIVVTILLGSVLSGLLADWYRRFRLMYRKKTFVKSLNPGVSPRVKKTESADSLNDPHHNLKKNIDSLRRNHDYVGIAEIYISLEQPKEAAEWYEKAGDRRRAAAEWVKAGDTLKAADLLMSEGDYAAAAHIYTKEGEHFQAARAYLEANDFQAAGAAFTKAGKFAEAANVFIDYFKASELPTAQATTGEVKIAAAEACLAMLKNEGVRAVIPAPSRRELILALAERFTSAKRYETAAQLYRKAKDWSRAGETYILAGKLEKAAECFHAAGKTKEAHQATAQFYENAGKWAEAGEAYGHAGDWNKAADCFTKAFDAQRAAECYEKAGEAYQAGLAHSRLGHFEEAIHHLQQVGETDENFDEARGLLGRCFYELRDYAPCAAALENHLMNKPIDSANLEWFYTLALAYERLENLEKSRETLYKIRSINIDYRDVAERIENITLRITTGSGTPVASPAGAQTPDTLDAHVMGMVENLLGGRYRLERELGRGGMGTVYLAFDTQLDRPVALKFLGTLTDGSESYRERFVREAKAAARVSHPNVISIYDIGASQGKAYIAMEYVEGPNLHAFIREKGGLPPREAADIITQACAALDAIHKAGIVHRDIKPDNILIAKGDLVKLMDFGLAKADERITTVDVVMGTPSYMSPEQTRNSDVDARSDIYSLGLVLHEALTGKTVFAPGQGVLKRQQQETPKPPSEIINGISKILDDIVMKCVEKKPEDRYQTAEELLADLRNLTS